MCLQLCALVSLKGLHVKEETNNGNEFREERNGRVFLVVIPVSRLIYLFILRWVGRYWRYPDRGGFFSPVDKKEVLLFI